MTSELCEKAENMLESELRKLLSSAEDHHSGMSCQMIDNLHHILESMEHLKMLKVSVAK